MKNKSVLISGGTGGLGRAVTRLALEKGARVTIPVYASKEIDALKSYLSAEKFERVRFEEADLISEKEVSALMERMEQLDVLLHLVGGFSMGKAASYTMEQWQKDFQLNVNTTFLTVKHALNRMLENQYGRIVTVGSGAAVNPSGGLAGYSASKAAVVAFTQSVADETKGTAITANSVLPSIIDTPANREAMGAKNADKWVKPESLAEVICFLGSEAAGDLRGAVIPVFGNV